MTARFGREIGEWSGIAAGALRFQLERNKATPHRFVTDAFAPDLGFSEQQVARVGDALDLMQVSFDLADNVADREQDLASGRDYFHLYGDLSLPVLTYLPATLLAGAIDLLHRHFGGESFTAEIATTRVAATVGEMLVGQSKPSHSDDSLDLLSGKQGLLLSIPFWLKTGARDLPCEAEAFEKWAYQFGCSWELGPGLWAER